ncbi:cyclopropane-fatty-acyl-phospholipid synthase family protein [Paraburkholderia sp. BCC1876]|uniref:SAM-dependent methyltransferase n=1 Tax=Paraburkholderia sp. BCC1876 TaxID=2676303 RepID=UPI001FC8EB73|nr:cyclopropane-fatty-acyl-phospholipid synthase family protein [Paraburkholderia sp. BCC1876]
MNLPIELALWSGQTFKLGRFDQPAVRLRAIDSSVIPALLSPSLDTPGEAYVQQKLDVEGSLTDVIGVAYKLAQIVPEKQGFIKNIARRFARSKTEDKEAIAYHYDVSNEFYQLWLDKRMVYSCVYLEHGDETLEQAQLQKIDHILNRIQVAPGNTLLDIGCGWGALVIRAAERFGIRCVGITLSDRQFDLARERVADAGLDHLVEIRLQDYRDVSGTFDRITSVGMFEHVGLDNLPGYFRNINSLLADNGVVLNHGITSTDAQSGDTPFGGGTFIDKYVFPSGALPHLSFALKCMQEGGLEALDVENLRRHYRKTLEMWTAEYERHGAKIRSMIGEQKYRIGRVYLAGCAHAFSVDNVAIFQVLCQKAGKPATSIPTSRRYMYDTTSVR